MNGRLSSFLNASRWIAAVIVMVAHARHLILVEYREVIDRTPLVKAFYFLTGLGHEAVMIFFVVSGYLVGGLAIVRFQTRGFDVVDYAVHRTSRIYTVLIPALLLGGLLDLIGLELFNRSGLYTGSAPHAAASIDFVISNNLNLSTLLANLAMLEGIASERLGSNGPLWSLAYEWWYYVIFAMAMTLVAGKQLFVRVLSGTILLALVLLLPRALLFWGIMWLVGVGAALYGETKLWKAPGWLGLLVFGLALVASRLSHSSEASGGADDWLAWARDFGLAVSFAFLVIAFRKDGKPVPFAPSHGALADFSYTLYLVHFPMLLFGIALLYDLFGVPFIQQPGWRAYIYFAGLSVAAFAAAWLLSLVTEANTGRVRRGLSTLVNCWRKSALLAPPTKG
jgi:peptidoglycan/LPS O-acetylase OafA/YrhL